MGRLNHLEEKTEALSEDRSGSPIQKDPKARKHTGVGYLANREWKRGGHPGSRAPRLDQWGHPLKLMGRKLDPESNLTL